MLMNCVAHTHTPFCIFPRTHQLHQHYFLHHYHTHTLNSQQDSFADPADKGNKEYLVACAFSHIHMQQNGELNLFGIASSNPFFRQFMEKYGIQAHVFKHGKYKSE
jgi:hypothetical protein